MGIVITYAWQLYKFGFAGRPLMKPHLFWTQMGTELDNNNFDVRIQRNRIDTTSETSVSRPSSGKGVYLTPTRKRISEKGITTQAKRQKLCANCAKKSCQSPVQGNNHHKVVQSPSPLDQHPLIFATEFCPVTQEIAASTCFLKK